MEGVPEHGNVRTRLHRRGQRIGEVGRVRQRERRELAELLDRHLLVRRVDGGERRGLARAVEVVRANGELVALELAAQADPRAGTQLLGEPDLVEPHRRDAVGVVLDDRADEREAARRPAQRDAAHLARDRDLLVGEEVGDRTLRHGRLVAARGVEQQVADGPQAELRQLALQRGPHAGEGVERRVEPLGARGRARQRPAVRLLGRREKGGPAHRSCPGRARRV